MEFVGAATRLAESDIVAEAAELRCEAAALWAVCDVESAGAGFLPDGRPKILFEAHIFGRLTQHRWDKIHPNLSAARWNRSLYGTAGAHQYDRLAAAVALDRNAALEAASWGMFQILALNYGRCGFAAAEDFVRAMCLSEAAQLAAFGSFCWRGGLDPFLRSHDWVRFALGYNGAGEASQGYDKKLAAAYQRRAQAVPHRPLAIARADHPVLFQPATVNRVANLRTALVDLWCG